MQPNYAPKTFRKRIVRLSGASGNGRR